MNYSLSDRVRLDRYAIKNPNAVLKPNDLVVVSLLRKGHDSKDRESREVGVIVHEMEGNRFCVNVPEQKAEVTTPGVTVSTKDGEQRLIGVPRPQLEYIVEQDWETICRRVAAAMAPVDAKPDATEFITRLAKAMTLGYFAAAGRILSGLGRYDLPELTLYNCFIFAIEQDSRAGITKHLGRIFDTYARGGGVGWDLSILRPKGAIVKKVNGRSSGVITWAELFSHITGAVEQGGSRRGSAMQALQDWHPDIFDFITAKSLREDHQLPNGELLSLNKKLIYNANVSVLISAAFMTAVAQNADWNLVFPDIEDPDYDVLWDGNLNKWKELGKRIITYRTVKARDLWNLIIKRAWEAGEPGLLFIDRANELSNSYYYAKLVCTNPCVAGDTFIFTETGITSAEQLANNKTVQKVVVDSRFGTQDNLQKASALLCTGEKTVCRVQTKEGYYVRCTPDHRIMTSTGWVEAKNLAVGDKVHILNRPGAFGTAGSPALGRILGWLVGDGCVSGASAFLCFYGGKRVLTSLFVDDIKNFIAETTFAPPVTKICCNTYEQLDKDVVSSRQLAKIFETMGVTKENLKTDIPSVIFSGTKETQIEFLRALFAADGTVNATEEKRFCSGRLDAASVCLLEQVQILLLNHGIYSIIYKNRRKPGMQFMPDGHGGQKEYKKQAQHTLSITKQSLKLFAETVGFLLPVKQQKLEKFLAAGSRGPYRDHYLATVLDVIEENVENVYDLTEPVTNSFIANGIVVHNCGEVYGPINGVCNLSHINLAKFVTSTALPTTETTSAIAENNFNWPLFCEAVQDGVRFLDNIIDLNKYHDEGVKKQQDSERRIGLGILGYGEMLVRLGLRYGTEEALKFSDSLFACLWRESYMASALLAEERGAFPACDIAKFMQSGFMQQKHLKEVPAHFKMQNLLPTQVFEQIEKHGMRNVTVNTIAPTGTVSVILETTSGIEPYFDLEYKMTTRIGTSDEQVNLVGLLTKQFGAKTDWPSYVVTAQKGISPEQHIKTQAIAQKWIDASIAKTANLPNNATTKDVETAYRLLWDLGCKGGTVYRDGSRDEQVFYTHATPETHSVPIAVETTLDAMRPRLEVGIGPTFSVPSPVGSLHVTIRHDPITGDPEDIFITSGKGDVAADVQALGRLCSLILRLNGVPLSQQSKMELIREQLAGIPGRTQDGLPGQVRVSMPDTIAHVITRYLEGNFPLANVPFGSDLVDSLCEDFATMPVDMLKKLALYLKNKTAVTPETVLKEQDENENKQKQLDFCPACGTMSYLVIPGKCGECKSCGYSRCG